MSKENKTIRRKLQFAGSSSYVITLPKPWIKGVGLDSPESEVFIEELPDRTIRIRPTNMRMELTTDKEIEIPVGKEASAEDVIRLVVASYLGSRSRIVIKSIGEDMLSPEVVLAINEIVQKLWGSEIIEDTTNRIVIHDALDPAQLKLKEIIRKAWFTANNMIQNAIEAVFNKDEGRAKIVVNSEKTLDKLYYLALRQLYHASKHALFSSEIGISPAEIIDYHLLIKNIERIGDHCEQIVGNRNNEIKNGEKLKEILLQTREGCEMAVMSFIDGDMKQAQEAISYKAIIQQEISSIGDIPGEFGITKSLLRLADYASDIGELTINRLIADM